MHADLHYELHRLAERERARARARRHDPQRPRPPSARAKLAAALHHLADAVSPDAAPAA